MNEDRIVEQLDSLVSHGRLTEEEAGALRAAAGTAQFETLLGAIRARHAGRYLRGAVSAGTMTQAEADAALQQLRAGEHAAGLRARLRNLGAVGGEASRLGDAAGEAQEP